jgi:hypothetical protein
MLLIGGSGFTLTKRGVLNGFQNRFEVSINGEWDFQLMRIIFKLDDTILFGWHFYGILILPNTILKMFRQFHIIVKVLEAAIAKSYSGLVFCNLLTEQSTQIFDPTIMKSDV